MTFKETTIYTPVCDCCLRQIEFDEVVGYVDKATAMSRAEEYEGWVQIDGEQLCDDCWGWPDDLPDYPGDELYEGSDDPVRLHRHHPVVGVA